MSLSRVQIASLAMAATPIVKQDDLDRYLNLPNREEILEVLKEEQANDRRRSVKETAMSIIALVKGVEEIKVQRVSEIREYRRRIKREQDTLNKLDRALAYGAETGNYIPLVAMVEGLYELTPDQRELAIIPEDWKPAVKPETA